MRKWSNVLPHTMAQQQEYWERRRRIWRAWCAGAQQREIAKKLGISTSRVQQICERVEREIKWKKNSPLEVHLAGSIVVDLRLEIEARREREKEALKQRLIGSRTEYDRWRGQHAKEIDAGLRRISAAIERREALRERIPHWAYRAEKTLPQEQAELIVNLGKVRDNLDLLQEMGMTTGEAWEHLMRPY